MKFSILLSTLLITSTVLSQTLPDQQVSRFGDDNTPYPLYGGSFGMDLQFTDADIKVLGENFDAFYGSAGIDYSIARKIRRYKPDFQFISYRGNWRVSRHEMPYVENGNRHKVLYYRAGNLKNALQPEDTILHLTDMYGSLLPSTAKTDSLKSYYDGGAKYVTILKIGNEYVKIIAVNEDKITVHRGLNGTESKAYLSGTPVLTNVYGRPPDPESNRMPEFRHDSRSLLRWKYFLKSIIKEYNENGGGIWIDILIGNLSHYAMSGETVPDERIWDIESNSVYDKNKRAMHAENGIRYIQETFYSIYDEYPLIWGNNMMFPVEPDNDRLRMLLQTENKPRPIDGFAMENCFAQYGYGGHSGKEFFYTSYDDWKQVMASIIYMGELKVSARPLMMDGGIDNKKFASLPKARRHDLYLYSYASYLLGVKVETNGKIYSKLGLCPVIFQEDGNHYFEIAPCFTWAIGKPVETVRHNQLDSYRIEGTSVYKRAFENGVVVVNPSDNNSFTITADQLAEKNLFFPDSGEQFTSLTLNPKKGLLLLFNE